MRDVVVLAAGTDGSDGPTDAAGAVVDPDARSSGRAGRGSTSGERWPRTTPIRSSPRSDDLVVTGPTGSNLMDVYLGVVG